MKTYTGKTGAEHNERMEKGRDFIVFEFLAEDKLEVFPNMSDEEVSALWRVNDADAFTRVRAFDEQDAKNNYYEAHDQWEEFENKN